MRVQNFAVLLAVVGCVVACSEQKTLPLGSALNIPPRADFKEVPVGRPARIDLQIFNTTVEESSIIRIERGEGFEGQTYAFQVTGLPDTVPANGSATFTVSFEAYVAMDTTAESSFIVVSSRGQNEVKVSGRGVAAVKITPARLDFGQVVRGEARRMDITVENILDTPLTIQRNGELEDLGGEGAFILPNHPGGSRILLQLAPRQTGIIPVEYRPAVSRNAIDPDRARLTLNYCNDHPLCETAIDLAGSGTESSLICTPSSIDFGRIGSALSEVRMIGCRVAAETAVNVEAAVVNGANAEDVVIRANVALPARVEAGEVITFTVVWTSNNGDLNAQAEIAGRLVSTGRAIRTVEIPLHGIIGGEAVSISPDTLDFGTVALGTQVSRVVQVHNSGTTGAVVHLDPDSLGTGQYSSPSGDLLSLSPGEILSVEIVFRPTIEGIFASEAVIDDLDPSLVLGRVQLSGSGIRLGPCQYRTSEDPVFGFVELARERVAPMFITNTGNDDCLLRDFALDGVNPSEFFLQDPPAVEHFLPPGRSMKIDVGYRPLSEGEHHTNLVFYASTPTGEGSGQLSGFGGTQGPTIYPDAIDFGNVELTCASQIKTIRVHNPMTTSIVIGAEMAPGTTNELTTVSAPGMPVTIVPNGTAIVQVRYTPVDAGEDWGALRIYVANTTRPHVVRVRANSSPNRTVETVRQASGEKMDILLVANHAISMTGELAELTTHFSQWIDSINASGVDFQLSVLDVSAGPGLCVLDAQPPGGESNGACGYFGAPADHHDWRIIDPADRPSPAAAFQEVLNLAPQTFGVSRALEATRTALRAPLIQGWNDGFLRKDASLAVIYVSDGHDSSAGAVQAYVDELLAIHGARNRHATTIAAIAGDPISGCSGLNGNAGDGTKFYEAAVLSGGYWESICTSDWARSISDLSVRLFGYRTQFSLENEPRDGDVEVRVDGVIVPDITPGGVINWTYEASQENSVVFRGPSTPEPGSEITFSYDVHCE
jgi:hypothetical protein